MNKYLGRPGSTQKVPRKVVEHKGYWYMSKGDDCCLKTGIGVLTYDDNLLLQGLTQLTPVKGESWRSHPFYKELADEFTRESLISALTALSEKDLVTAKQAITKTKIDFGADWFWLKAIQNEDNWKGKIYAKLFALFISPVSRIPAVDMQLYTMRKLGLGNFPLLSKRVRNRQGNTPLVSLYTGKKIDKSIIKNSHSADKDLLWKLYNEL